MELYQILNLNCKEKENRKRLLKEVMQAISAKEKPDIELLKKWSNSIGKKYKMPIQTCVERPYGNNKIIASIKRNDSYIMLICNSKYELYAKHILIVKSYLKG